MENQKEKMEIQTSKMKKNPLEKYDKIFILKQIILRTMAFCFALAATITMATSEESEVIIGIQMVAKYTSSPAFRFFVGANAVASAYSFLSMPFVFILSYQKWDDWSFYLMFLLDLLMMGLMIGGASAATAIGYVGRNGNAHAMWLPICDYFGKFCNRAQFSLICSFVAVVPFLVLLLMFATPKQTTFASY